MEIPKRSNIIPWLKELPDSWDQEILFTEGDDYFADLLNGIDAAKQSVEIETYIFEKGQLGHRLVDHLVKAAGRGVTVSVLVDGIGSPGFWSEFGIYLQKSGVNVRLFRTWPWQLRWMQASWTWKAWEFFRRWLWINRGNHRKTCIVDRVTAWVGSFNISDVHLREVVGRKAWIDVGVRIRGIEVLRLRSAFMSAFEGNFVQNPFQPRDSLLFLNSSLILRKTAQHHQVRRMRRAQHRIWLQTPYFVPIASIYRAMIKKARQGADVRLIVPSHSDVPFMRILSHSFFRKLLKSGVRIYEFRLGFIHQKISHIDNWVVIGSSNLNHRSFLHDFEVDVVLRDPRNIENLEKKFLQEQYESQELTFESLYRLPWYKRMVSRILFYLRYWA